MEWHERMAPGGAKRRVSCLSDAARLLAHLVRHGVRTIAFVLTRSVAELLVTATRELVGEPLRDKVGVYRAGYTAQKRRSCGVERCISLRSRL